MSYVPSNITKAIITSFAKEAKVLNNVRAEQDKCIQKALDAMLTACTVVKSEFLKGNAKTNEARREIKELFDAIVETGSISKASGAMYQSSFWIAFENGGQFKRDLASKAKATTNDTTKTPSPKRTVSASRENLDRVLTQAIEMARQLGLTEFAANVVDLAVESLDGFEEVK